MRSDRALLPPGLSRFPSFYAVPPHLDKEDSSQIQIQIGWPVNRGLRRLILEDPADDGLSVG
eukprot:c28869_g2_i1 orf=172-357(-)